MTRYARKWKEGLPEQECPAPHLWLKLYATRRGCTTLLYDSLMRGRLWPSEEWHGAVEPVKLVVEFEEAVVRWAAVPKLAPVDHGNECATRSVVMLPRVVFSASKSSPGVRPGIELSLALRLETVVPGCDRLPRWAEGEGMTVEMLEACFGNFVRPEDYQVGELRRRGKSHRQLRGEPEVTGDGAGSYPDGVLGLQDLPGETLAVVVTSLMKRPDYRSIRVVGRLLRVSSVQ